MPRPGVGPRRFVDRQPVMGMMPIVGRGVGRIDAERFDGIDQLQHALDFRPAGQAQQAFAAGLDIRHSRAALAGATARKMSMRETTVPKSFDIQRTNAKMLPGANDRTRRRRSRIRSSAARPKRIRFSMRFSSHSSSTCVRSLMRLLRLLGGQTPWSGPSSRRSGRLSNRLGKQRGPR